MTAPWEETGTRPVEVTCPGCFHPREWDIAGVCPICHYRAGLEGRSGALLPVGTQLKGYVVGEKLGQGGFGITYRGFDLTLKMKVAIKEYYPSDLVGRSTDRKTVVLNSPEHGDLFHYGRRTFLQEARTVAQLRHPHLVRVLNFFELNDTAYLVMDYYEGEDLARHLKASKGQPLPWRRAVALLLPVLDGLRKVHQAGFMHRDIKPGNLYLTSDDELILLDFGSARQVTGTHTRSLLIFSAGYAPYEQYLQGQLNRQGPWTDVYGAAATLYLMVTGQYLPPALDRKQAALMQQPDPLKPARHWVPDLPSALDAALLRALALEPEQRLQTIQAFQQHLAAALAEADRPPPEPTTTPTLPIPPKKGVPEPPKAAPTPPPKPKIAPEPPKSNATPTPPKASPQPKVAPAQSARPKSRTVLVALVVVVLTALSGWWFWEKLGVAPKLPVTPAAVAPPVVTPPVVESPPPVAPPVVEPRTYLTVRATPATAQIRILNIGPAYRDGIELTPGAFDLEVSAPGYQTYRAWLTLAAGAQEVVVVLQPNPPVAPPATPIAPPPTAEDIARQKELELQLAVVKKLLEARKIPAARRALDDAKPSDREGRVEAFRREQTATMQATALVFLEQGQRNLAKRVVDDLGQWDPKSSEYRALRARLTGGQ